MNDRKLDRLFQRYRRRGDAAALATVFDLAAPELLRLARHLCADEAEAEDAVQASFVTAIRKRDSYDARRRFLPWIVGILARHAKEERRRAERVPHPDRLVAREARDPADLAEEGEFLDALRSAVRDLPETYARAVHAYLLEGQPPARIAEELGVSPGATHVRLHRGLKLLRRALPAGIGLGAAWTAAPTRGLASVRDDVLREAGGAASALTAAKSGAGLVSARSFFVLAALLLAVGVPIAAWHFAGREGGGEALARTEAMEPLAADVHAAPTAALTARGPEEARIEFTEQTRLLRYTGRVAELQSGVPIAGAEVRVSFAPDAEPVCVSDADGRIEFDAPIGADDELWIRAPGFAAYRAPLDEDSRARRREVDGHSVDLFGGSVWLGDLRLERGTLVRGVVLDANGTPVRDAELVAFHHRDTFGGSVPVALSDHVLAVSDARGRFTLEDRLPWIAPGRGDHALFACTEDRLGWALVGAVEGRDALDVEIRLRSTCPLEVVAQDMDGRPLAGVHVEAVPQIAPWSLSSGGTDHRGRRASPRPYRALFTATTDEAGRCELPALPCAEGGGHPFIAVIARARGYELEAPALIASPLQGGKLVLRAAALEGVTLVGRVTDAEGRAVGGVTVSAAGVETETDARGRYRLPDVPPKSFPLDVDFSSPDHPPARRRVAASSSAELDVKLPAARVLAGRVVTSAGQPLAGVRVYPVSDGRQLGGLPTDEDGRFRYDNADAEPWTVTASWRAAGGERTRSEPVVARGGREDVTVVLDPPAPAPSGALRVTLEDARTGARLDAREAELLPARREPGRRWARVTVQRQAGALLLEHVPAGEWRLWVHVAGYPAASLDVDLDAGESRVARMRFGESASVSGTVTFRVDAPAPGARVRFTMEGSVPTGSWAPEGHVEVELDADGRFRAEDLHPGPWRIALVDAGAYIEDRVLDLAGGEHLPLTLTALPTATFRVVSDELPEHTLLSVLTEARGAWQHAWAGQGLPAAPLEHRPGRCRWRVELWRLSLPALEATGELELQAGEERTVRIPRGAWTETVD